MPQYQNLLCRTICQHLRFYARNVAAIAVTSSNFRNSSIGPNLLSEVTLHVFYLPLFSEIFFSTIPRSISTLQFSPALTIYTEPDEIEAEDLKLLHEFVTTLISATPYFCKSLTSIEIDDEQYETDFSIFITCFDKEPVMPYVNSLTFNSEVTRNMHGVILHITKYFPSLTSLNLKSCVHLKDDDLKLFRDDETASAHSKITSLDLSNCHEITHVGIRHLASSSRFQNLQQLELSLVYRISNETCKILASPQHFPLLTDLNLRGWKLTPTFNDGKQTIDEGLSAICDPTASHLTQNLRTFRIGGLCTSVSLKKIGFLQNLKTLQLSKNNELNDEVIVCICTNLAGKSIENLHLDSAEHLTKKSFEAITLNLATTLTCLKVIKCSNIDEETLLWIGSRMLKLNCLMLITCSIITDAGIKCLFSGVDPEEGEENDDNENNIIISPVAKTLQTFNLGWCETLTDESLKCMIKKCQKLEEFSCSGSKKFTDIARRELKKKLVKKSHF